MATWACAWRSGPTASPAARPRQPHDVRRAVAGLRPPRCPSARSPTGCTHPPGRRRSDGDLGRELAGSPSSCANRTCGSGCSRWTRSHLVDPLPTAGQAGRGRPRRLRRSWLERGPPRPNAGWIATAFDPRCADDRFARRVPTYKRLTLMLRDPERLRALLLDESAAAAHRGRQVAPRRRCRQGAHPAGCPLRRRARCPAHRIAFLPDYDMSMARLLYWGCDVWLNNPLRPLEACGTSGMKSALNGGLNLSIRDGWWDEWYDGENGLGDTDRRRSGRRGAAVTTSRPARALQPAGALGRAQVLRPRRQGRADQMGGDGPPHPADAGSEGAGLPDGAGSTPRSTTHPPPRRCGGPSLHSTARRLAPPGNWPPTGARPGGLAADRDHRRRQHRAARHPAARLGADADRCRAAGRPDPDEVAVQAVLGRVDAGDALLEPASST